MKKIIDWLNWNVRINFIDNVWWPLFGKEKTPKIEMTGEQLREARQEFGLGSKAMAKLIGVSLPEYRRLEEVGLLAPHDTQGPAIRIIQMVRYLRKKVTENKRMLDMLGYKGFI